VVRGVAGTWKDLTDSVNFMASNVLSQVRNIADVTAAAKGDLTRKITVDVKGPRKSTISSTVSVNPGFGSWRVTYARTFVGEQTNMQCAAG
jgi:HAMP domain-containing protein